MVKLTYALISLSLVPTTIFGCNFRNSMNEDIVHGNGWSFRFTTNHWWFIQRGEPTQTLLVGGTYKNIGSRPVNVSISRTCDSLEVENSREDLGHGTKWMGSKIGNLFAIHDRDANSIQFSAVVPQGKCNLILKCEGDSFLKNDVEKICNSMVSSLEVHR